jgi:hypothetical protein
MTAVIERPNVAQLTAQLAANRDDLAKIAAEIEQRRTEIENVPEGPEKSRQLGAIRGRLTVLGRKHDAIEQTIAGIEQAIEAEGADVPEKPRQDVIDVLTADELDDEAKLAALDQIEATAEQMELAEMWLAEQKAKAEAESKPKPPAKTSLPKGWDVDAVIARSKWQDAADARKSPVPPPLVLFADVPSLDVEIELAEGAVIEKRHAVVLHGVVVAELARVREKKSKPAVYVGAMRGGEHDGEKFRLEESTTAFREMATLLGGRRSAR